MTFHFQLLSLVYVWARAVGQGIEKREEIRMEMGNKQEVKMRFPGVFQCLFDSK